jgi:PAS domain S-box-containing protein
MAESSAAFELSGVIDHLHEGIQVIGRDFTYLYLNEVAARHGRRSVEELVGRRMHDEYPGIESTEVFALLRRAMDGGGTYRLENEFTYPDGSKRWFELYVEGVPAGVVVLSLDVTERKMMDLYFRRAQRMEAVGQLAGGVAHDFNNLLTVIQSYASLALKELGEGHPLSQDLSVVLGACTSASDLTRKLMSFARQLPVEPQTVKVKGTVEKLAKLARGVLGQSIELTVEAEDDLMVQIDAGALDQVLLNLVINARDAMPSGGALSIEASRIDITEDWALSRATLGRGVYVVISVTDTGVGIPRGLLERVFDPFFTTKGESGVGLGLATCWGLIQQAGGTMNVYSEEGVGTTFKIYLPFEGAATADAEPIAVVEAPGAVGEHTILLVEDQEALRTVVCGVLRRAGYRVVEASAGAQALDQLDQVGEKPDLLLSDMSMPGMSGTELAGAVRSRMPGTPILLMSGLAARGFNAQQLAGAHLLSKPFTPASLLSAVARALTEGKPPPEGAGSRHPVVS